MMHKVIRAMQGTISCCAFVLAEEGSKYLCCLLLCRPFDDDG